MFGDRKRTFKELQKLILKTLKKDRLTPNQIAKKAKIRWEVVSHQLVLLKGLGCIEDLLTHPRFRIISITDDGKIYLKELEK